MADSVLGSAAGGAMKGAALGAQFGSVVPGIGNAVGAVGGAIAGGIAGGANANKAKKKQEEAQAYIPSYADPVQAQRLAEIDRIAQNIQSGTDAATQTAINQGAETTAATQNRLARVTGGNVGATVDALLKAQRAGGEAANTAIAQGQSRLPFFKDLGQQLANRIEQRALELGLLNRAQASAEGAQQSKENAINKNSFLASGVGMNELGDAGGRINELINNYKLSNQQPMADANQTVLNPGTEVVGQSLTGLSSVLPGF